MWAFKSNKKIFVIGLLISLCFIYLNNPLELSHSHIYSCGTIVTHTHSDDKCSQNEQNNKQENNQKQIIVYNSLMHVLEDSFVVFNYQKFELSNFSIILILNEKVGFYSILKEKSGRAPPLA